MFKHLSIVYALLLSSVACRRETPHPNLAFYHWQTTFRPSPSENSYLDALHCHKLYLKFLDIARAGDEIKPYALLDIRDTSGLSRKTIVPTVFIANSVFENITLEKIDWLAQKTGIALRSIARQCPKSCISPFHTEGHREIQFDCDWTPSTRVAFFAFLNKVRAQLPPKTLLSATIRLHQYKFPKNTGVPPVDRGMLMFYNTGDLDNPEAGNSIFLTKDAEKYVFGAPKHYPLPLDLALPLFSWTLVYRGNTLWKIIPGELDLSENPCLSKMDTAPEKQTDTHQVLCGTFLGGHYLRTGDWLRTEFMTPASLATAAALAEKIDLSKDASIAFFHLDSAVVRQFPVAVVNAIFAQVATVHE